MHICRTCILVFVIVPISRTCYNIRSVVFVEDPFILFVLVMKGVAERTEQGLTTNT